MGQDATVIHFLGVPVRDITYAETLSLVQNWIEQHRAGGAPRQIVTVNPEFVMLALRNRAFRRVLQRADLQVADGVGLQLLAPVLGSRIRERVTGSDLLPQLAQLAAEHRYRLYLLGAAPGVAEATAAKLVRMYPALQIAGWYTGSPARDEEAALVERIRNSRADLLTVAYGAPQQDLWLARNLQRTGAAIGIGVGGAYDHFTGLRKRAPEPVRRIGLEWLYRLITQPWRWRRMLALPVFTLLVLLAAAGRRFTSSDRLRTY